MKIKEKNQIIKDAIDYAKDIIGDDLETKLTKLGFYSDGVWNTEMANEARAFAEDEQVIEDLWFLYDEALYNEVDKMNESPETYGFCKVDYDAMDEDERFEYIAGIWNYSVMPAFQNFVIACIFHNMYDYN
jgi:hypothetical protein